MYVLFLQTIMKHCEWKRWAIMSESFEWSETYSWFKWETTNKASYQTLDPPWLWLWEKNFPEKKTKAVLASPICTLKLGGHRENHPAQGGWAHSLRSVFWKKILIGGTLLYNALLVSTIQQCESAISVPMSPSCWVSLPPHPTRSSHPLGCYRAPGWAPCVIEQLPNAGSIFK